LQNIDLQAADLCDLDHDALGEFDYIVCHGLYSWIPANAQDALLRLCNRHLANGGVAYISYNTYPGWKAKEILRDAMLLHGGQRNDLREQVAYARGMMGFLRQAARPGSVLSTVLDENLPALRGTGADYLAHEYLEPYNLPCYFRDFVARAGAHDLAYLAEAQPSMMVPTNYGRQVADPLLAMFSGDQVMMEQYLDFAINREFRQTLLVRDAAAAKMNRRLDRHRFQAMHFAASLPCIGGTTRLDGSMQEYGVRGQSSLETPLGAAKAAMDALTGAWPGTLSWHDLLEAALAAPDAGREVSPDVVVKALGELLELLITRGMARFRKAPVHVVAQPGPRPQVDKVVRRMAAGMGQSISHVTNAWYESIDLTAVERVLYPVMDGNADRQALEHFLADAIRTGVVIVDSSDSFRDPEGSAARELAAVLQRLPEQKVLFR
jgi:methyltransferase-like protein